jgi:hypothetical protein
MHVKITIVLVKSVFTSHVFCHSVGYISVMQSSLFETIGLQWRLFQRYESIRSEMFYVLGCTSEPPLPVIDGHTDEWSLLWYSTNI